MQLGATIFLFSYLGAWLDEHHPNNKVYFQKILAMVGVVLGLYAVLKQVERINKMDDKK